MKVFFVDPVRLSLAETNQGRGFELTFPRSGSPRPCPTSARPHRAQGRRRRRPPRRGAGARRRRAAPVAGRAVELKYEAIGAMAGMTNDPQLAAQLLDDIDQKYTSMLAAAAGETLPQGEESLGEQLNAPLQKSVKELDALLEGVCSTGRTSAGSRWSPPPTARPSGCCPRTSASLWPRPVAARGPIEATEQQATDAGAGGEQATVAATSSTSEQAGYAGEEAEDDDNC